MIRGNDKLPLWQLSKNVDMSKTDLIPVLHELGLPVELDPATGDVFSSRSELRQLLISVSEGVA